MKGIRMVSAFVLFNFAFPALLLAQGILENPADGSSIGGLATFSGWVCTATRMEIDVDGSILQAGYPTSRNDTIEACGDDGDNGFSLLINTNLYGDGEHTARLLTDGVDQQFTRLLGRDKWRRLAFALRIAWATILISPKECSITLESPAEFC